MLTRYDEFLCHQIPETFDCVDTSAREWTERIWFSAHDLKGNAQLIAGFGVYPNRNIMDAFALFVIDGKTQYCVRASRELRPAIDEVRVGPFSYEIIKPMETVRFSLAENPHRLAFQLDLRGTLAPHEEDHQFNRTRGRVLEHIKRYVQAGRVSGWIEADGVRYEANESTWYGERDHSWGIRRGGGVPETGVQPGEIPAGYLHNFVVAQFDGWGITYHLREDADARVLAFSGAVMYPRGNDRSERRAIRLEHHLRFESEIRHINGGTITLHFEDGDPIECSIRPQSACYLKAGGYFGFRGFTHGLWLGPSFLDGHVLNLTDPEIIREVAFLEDMACEFRRGDEVGYGIFELVLIGRYPKYGYLSY